MEDNVINGQASDVLTKDADNKNSTTNKNQEERAQYPAETIKSSITLVEKIVATKGTSQVASRDELVVILGKAEGTLNMKLSACVQYGLLENRHGKGYIATKLYQDYQHPVYGEEDRIKCQLIMLQNAPLYKKIINDLNGKILPNEDGFVNLLKGTYKIHTNAADRAAKIFFDNARPLNVIDGSNKLRFIMPNQIQPPAETPAPERQDEGTPARRNDEELPKDNRVTITIPLKSGKRADLLIPQDYTADDIKRIKKFVMALSDDDE